MFRSTHTAIALALAAGIAAPAVAETGKPHWGYEGTGDPSVWSELSPDYAACGAGTEQSPIDIHSDDAIAAEFTPAEISWTSFIPEVVNNGHTVQVNTNGQGGYAQLADTRYHLLQYHFHAASEHTVDGEHSALEVHFVHKSDAGDLLVVGALIEEGEENPALAALWPLMPGEEGTATGTDAVDPLTLVPDGGEAYRYAGSLTTPPCSEIVTWNVMVDPITASEAQIAAFVELYPNNNRPVQPTGRRFVLVSE